MTYRDREIIARSVFGASNKDIAAALRIEEAEVEKVLDTNTKPDITKKVPAYEGTGMAAGHYLDHCPCGTDHRGEMESGFRAAGITLPKRSDI